MSIQRFDTRCLYLSMQRWVVKSIDGALDYCCCCLLLRPNKGIAGGARKSQQVGEKEVMMEVEGSGWHESGRIVAFFCL